MVDRIKFKKLKSDFSVKEYFDEAMELEKNTYVGLDTNQEADALEEAGVIDVLNWDFREKLKYEGEPEQILIEEDGEEIIGFIKPMGDRVEVIEGTKYECLRCGSTINIKYEYGEGIREPNYCSSCERKGPFELKTPEPISDPAWKPPTGMEEIGPHELYEETREYLVSHVNLEKRHHYDALAIWCVMTWVKDVFPFTSHIAIVAPTQSGKTRLCRTLRNLSYRGFSASTTSESALFRGIDEYDMTPFISEFSGLDKETRNKVHDVIRSGQKRGEKVLRSQREGDDWNITTFNTFTPLVVASQYDFPDDILNRSIVLDMRYDPEDINYVLEESELRNALLYFRFTQKNRVKAEIDSALRDLAEGEVINYEVKGRVLERLTPLLAVARVCDVDLTDFLEWAYRKNKITLKQQRHVMICSVISETIRGDEDLAVSNITDKYNFKTDSDVSPQWMGHRLKELGARTERGKSGKKVVPVDEAIETIKKHGEPFGVEVPDVNLGMEKLNV